MGHPPLEGLLKAPTFNREDDTRKVKRIFDWIGRNVRYDIDAFRRDLTGLATEKETGMTALRQCKATCAGFSDLFCMMCGQIGLPCVKIQGYAKGMDYTPGTSFSSPNHEWNAVFVAGGWQLVDVCWGSGYVSEATGQYEHHLTDHYLFTEPRDFVRDHLPLDDRWQLLSRDRIVSKQTFERQPSFKPGYFFNGIKSQFESEGILEADGCNPIEINLTLQKPMLITYRLLSVELGDVCNTFVSYKTTADRAFFRIQLPSCGKFIFTIYGCHCGSLDSVRALMAYTLISKHSLTVLPCLSRNILWGPTKAFHDFSIRAKSFSSVLPVDDRQGACLTLLCPPAKGNPLRFRGELHTLDNVPAIYRRCCSCTRLNDRITFRVCPPGRGCYRLILMATHCSPAQGTAKYSSICNCLVISSKPVASGMSLHHVRTKDPGKMTDTN